jgi:DnaK suppressor protein
VSRILAGGARGETRPPELLRSSHLRAYRAATGHGGVGSHAAAPRGTFATVSLTTDNAFAGRIRASLEEDLAHTDARIAALEHALSDFTAATRSSASEDEHDEDAASMAIERSQTSILLDSAREHRHDITDALARLDAGTYGICENCGQPISPERLEARPVARLCIRCASALRHG